MADLSSLSESRLRAAMQLETFDGRAAQRLVEPVRRGRRPAHAARSAPRVAAALAYLFVREGSFRVPFTVRRQDLPEHRGQVSLPGGRPATGEPLWATARREALEEIGLDGDGLELLGRLAPVYIPVTHTVMHVHVALGRDPGSLVPCPREVERIEIVRLADLLDPTSTRVTQREIQGGVVDVPYFDVNGLFLWGATAMAISELVERLRGAT